MAATIKDVARRAKVSVATVSRLVNGTGNVSEKSAERIRAAIAELGFRPNAVGRSLKTARTKALGVVTPSISNPVFAETVAGIIEAGDEEEAVALTLEHWALSRDHMEMFIRPDPLPLDVASSG